MFEIVTISNDKNARTITISIFTRNIKIIVILFFQNNEFLFESLIAILLGIAVIRYS
jgi:hypothetical protein